LDYVSHDLELMMPGSQLMITGAANYGSVGGGIQQMGGIPPVGIPPMGGMGLPPMGPIGGMGGMGPMGSMGGFGQTSPYGSTRPF
jgi:hypothetical protein